MAANFVLSIGVNHLLGLSHRLSLICPMFHLLRGRCKWMICSVRRLPFGRSDGLVPGLELVALVNIWHGNIVDMVDRCGNTLCHQVSSRSDGRRGNHSKADSLCGISCGLQIVVATC